MVNDIQSANMSFRVEKKQASAFFMIEADSSHNYDKNVEGEITLTEMTDYTIRGSFHFDAQNGSGIIINVIEGKINFFPKLN